MELRHLRTDLTQQPDHNGIQGVTLEVKLPETITVQQLAEIAAQAKAAHLLCVQSWGLRIGDSMVTNVGSKQMVGNVSTRISDKWIAFGATGMQGDRIVVTIEWN